MKTTSSALLRKRRALLARLAKLEGLVQGSYLERFSTCIRRQCACHRGRPHGPRGYLVVYQNKKQRQIYIPLAERAAIVRGVKQYEALRATVQAVTRLNLQLMRQRTLRTSIPRTTAPS